MNRDLRVLTINSFPEWEVEKNLADHVLLFGRRAAAATGLDCSSKPLLESVTDSDNSSVADCSVQSDLLKDVSIRPQRRISFSQVQIREYAVTIGDHPMCSDGMPLSLDWDYYDEQTQDIDSSSERLGLYKFPRRLSYEERRDRVCTSVGADFGTCCDVTAVIDMLHLSWSQTRILPAPDLYDIEDMDDEDDEADDSVDDDAMPTLEIPVIHWKRNHAPLRRSQSFCS
jgi:hypothetical protein